MLALAAAIVMAIAVFLGVRALAPEEGWVDPSPKRGFVARKREELFAKSAAYRAMSYLIFIPAYQIGRRNISAWRSDLSVRLARAGYPGGLTADEFIAVQALCGLSGGIIAGLFGTVFLEAFSVPMVLSTSLMAAWLPSFWLEDRLVRRMTAMNRHLPFAMDVLSLSLGAGLDFVGALEQFVAKESQPGPLVEELHYVLQEMRLGVTRKQALLNMRDRVQSEYMNTVVGAIVQAEQMGTPLSQVLRIQSQANRLRRTQRAERIAAEASVKILFPLMLILMAVFLTLFGPVMIRYMNGELV